MLNVILFGRNDDYHSDYIDRTSAAINFNLNELAGIGKLGSVKFIFIDWASVNHLSETIAINPKFRNSVEFIYLSEEFLNANNENIRIVNSAFACNIGLLHSCQKYVFFQASDIITHSDIWDNLLNYLQSNINNLTRKYFLIERAFIDNNFLKDKKSFDEMRLHLKDAFYYYEEISGAGGGAGSIGGERNFLLSMGGMNCNINNTGRGIDIDLFMRVSCNSVPLNLSKHHNVQLFKIPYSQNGKRRSKIGLQPSWGKQLLSEVKPIQEQSKNNIILPRSTPNFFKKINSFTLDKSVCLEVKNGFFTFAIYLLSSSNTLSHKNFKNILTIKCCLQKGDFDLILINGNFTIEFWRAIFLISPSVNILWRYKPGNEDNVYSVLNSCRNRFGPGRRSYYKGKILLQSDNFSKNHELRFLNGTQFQNCLSVQETDSFLEVKIIKRINDHEMITDIMQIETPAVPIRDRVLLSIAKLLISVRNKVKKLTRSSIN